jgi:hypothetical protein
VFLEAVIRWAASEVVFNARRTPLAKPKSGRRSLDHMQNWRVFWAIRMDLS